MSTYLIWYSLSLPIVLKLVNELQDTDARTFHVLVALMFVPIVRETFIFAKIITMAFNFGFVTQARAAYALWKSKLKDLAKEAE